MHVRQLSCSAAIFLNYRRIQICFSSRLTISWREQPKTNKQRFKKGIELVPIKRIEVT
jgi:hypothetical protein